MKSKWDNLKEEWKRWSTLVHIETGLGWDLRKKTIDASNEWWESKIQANPKVKVFRMRGIPPNLEVLLERMFRDTVATRGITWNPAQCLRMDEDVETTQPDIGDGTGSTDDNLECHEGEQIAEPIVTWSRKDQCKLQRGKLEGREKIYST